MNNERLKPEDIEYVWTKYDPDHAQLTEYFILRYNVYREFDLDYYFKPEPTGWDRTKHTMFLLLVNKYTKKTVGGRRFIIREPGGENIVYIEANTRTRMKNMLPHLADTSQLHYVESGALCFHKSIRGVGADIEMYKQSFAWLQEIDADFVMSSPVPHNMPKIEKAALANGIKQIVWRDDLPSVEDGDGDPTMFMSFKTESELDLRASKQMKKTLLTAIFSHDFTEVSAEDFTNKFTEKTLTIGDLELVHSLINRSSYRGIDGVLKIGEGKNPIMLMTQLHGNEPAGLAAILYAIALFKAGLLEKPILAVLGNNLAAEQYFKKLDRKPQETRDVYRRGTGEDGFPLADMNRVPSNFRSESPKHSAAIKRWQELDHIADKSCGVIDIHSARGNMVCITDSSDDKMLKHSPIRNILVGLSEAIGSATETSTFKTILSEKENLQFLFGIEAGTHEDKNAFRISAEFIAALLYNLEATKLKPEQDDDGIFYNYKVGNKISFSDLEGSPKEDEEFSSVKQFEEMEAIQAEQILATGDKGTELRAKFAFSALFVTKSKDKFSDPAIGLYPTKDLSTKFCYPCEVSEMKIDFS